MAEDTRKAKRLDSKPYSQRIHVLKQACKSRLYHQKAKLKQTKKKYLLYNKQNNFLFCFVQKVGCTFWKRIFLSLENKMDTNLTDLSLVHKMDLPIISREYRDVDVKNFSKSAFSVLFVRDPYSRLFSGYIDKFLYPNPHYWSVYGAKIIRKYRKNASLESMQCGYDVTFAEFVEYVVDTYDYKPRLLEDHFSPIHQHCRPCEIDYKIIGKMETFGDDVNYVFGELRDKSFRQFSVRHNFSEELLQIANDLRYYKNLNKTCLREVNVSERVLKTLYLRGFISKDKIVTCNISSLTASSVKYYRKILSSKIIKEEKRQQLVAHYKSLGKPLLDRVRSFVKPDCLMFGYSERPDDIFNH
ncbi:carbohydrate sulfotransferase 14-like [Mytilus californianus]|uniref:carbohydrate sulfotransferase 14-like n=1 Tax=Mytilus californianus TaxID=6549 RepID=UPI0022464090|nr:carbohydrate sulfotransferase 14-like [Mytilus californianus]